MSGDRAGKHPAGVIFNPHPSTLELFKIVRTLEESGEVFLIALFRQHDKAMNKLSKRIELLANVAIIVVAVMLAVVLLQRYFLTKTAPAQEIAVGTKISLPEVEWAKNGKTMLVVLQRGCRFCTESAPFYQRLVQTAADKKVKLIAVFPHSPLEGRDYLGELGVPITDIRQSSLNSIGVRGTPTLILVDDKGAVAATWVGKLPPAEESDLLGRL